MTYDVIIDILYLILYNVNTLYENISIFIINIKGIKLYRFENFGF